LVLNIKNSMWEIVPHFVSFGKIIFVGVSFILLLSALKILVSFLSCSKVYKTCNTHKYPSSIFVYFKKFLNTYTIPSYFIDSKSSRSLFQPPLHIFLWIFKPLILSSWTLFKKKLSITSNSIYSNSSWINPFLALFES
jgi:hypothetical protein